MSYSRQHSRTYTEKNIDVDMNINTCKIKKIDIKSEAKMLNTEYTKFPSKY